MSRFIDLTRERFGRLTVVAYAGKDNWNRATWSCVCDCGQRTVVQSGNLRSGHTKSCGCLNAEKIQQQSVRHGHYKNGKMSKTYKAWSCMIQRCTNPKRPGYHRYGGRGITVCKRWIKFESFLKDMGDQPPGHQLDRIDNNGNYRKKNCRWTTPKQQARNRRDNRLITYKGKTQCLAAWAEKFGVSPATLWQRLFKLHWSINKALTTPVKKRRKKDGCDHR